MLHLQPLLRWFWKDLFATILASLLRTCPRIPTQCRPIFRPEDRRTMTWASDYYLVLSWANWEENFHAISALLCPVTKVSDMSDKTNFSLPVAISCFLLRLDHNGSHLGFSEYIFNLIYGEQNYSWINTYFKLIFNLVLLNFMLRQLGSPAICAISKWYVIEDIVKAESSLKTLQWYI